MNKLWRDLSENFALVACFPDQFKIKILKIANTAMYEFGWSRTGAIGKVIFFEEEHFEPTHSCIAGNTSAIDTAANDDEIEAAWW